MLELHEEMWAFGALKSNAHKYETNPALPESHRDPLM